LLRLRRALGDGGAGGAGCRANHGVPHPRGHRCLAQGQRLTGGKATMKLSARNILKGKVVAIEKGKVTGIVRVDVGGGNVITSSITMAAIKDLKLKKGSDVHAIIKASEVL